jgi:hypothetical protein
MVVFALLLTRMADAHMHLCFDGQEQPVSLHVSDGRHHHHDPQHAESGYASERDGQYQDASHHAQQHSDEDVDVADAALAKKASGVPPLAAGAYRLALAPADSFEISGVRHPVLSVSIHLHPPPRGPPV